MNQNSNWSPINKKQHIIYLNYESSEIYENNIKFEIYTDRTILEIKTDFVNYYYIEKGNTNNFLFSPRSFYIKKGDKLSDWSILSPTRLAYAESLLAHRGHNLP